MTAQTFLTSLPTIGSTEAKNDLSGLLDRINKTHSRVVITRHDRPAAVVLSADDYEALMRRIPDPLKELEAHFDQMVASMQTPAQRNAEEQLFGATPEQLGSAAARAATSKRRASTRKR